jgi:hypothetical protein
MGANAQTKVPTFASAEVLTAANQNLLSNGIPVFSGTATRDAAFGGSGEKTLAEGQFAFLEDTNLTQFYDGAAWLSLGGKLGQVVNADKTDTFTTSSTSYVDVTGWTATITPSATTSKILVLYSTTTSNNTGAYTGYQIVRGSTAIGNGTASGSRIAANKGYYDATGAGGASLMGMFLDSPSTTSATTYKIQTRVHANTLTIGATFTGADNVATYSCLTNITLMEILA